MNVVVLYSIYYTIYSYVDVCSICFDVGYLLVSIWFLKRRGVFEHSSSSPMIFSYYYIRLLFGFVVIMCR